MTDDRSSTTLPALIDRARSAAHDSPFCRAPGEAPVTYDQLDDRVCGVAAELRHRGLAQGDRVVVQLEKSVDAVVLHLALLRLGVVQVPLNPAYTKAESAALINDADPRLVIDSPVQPRAGRDVPWPPLEPDDPAAMLYTSGTTGRPKGAVLSQANLASNAATLVEAWGFTADDHLLHILPLFHTHGLFVALHCVLASGASTTLLPRFDTDPVLHELPGATVMMGVPTHYSRLLDRPEFVASVTDGVRLFTSGSAPMSVNLHQRFRSRTGHTVLERYGMTETSMLTSNPLDGFRKPGTVGPALPNVDLRVVDAQDERCAVLDVGNVQVRGPNVFGGYWRRPDLQAEVFTLDGWFRTGDLGRFDSDGYLELVGRSKDLVITGGMNVYPSEVEAVLDAQPGVAESAVIGMPDEDLGEAVVALVVAAHRTVLDVERLRSGCRQRLAGFKVPKRIHVVEVLPRNAMGKVEKSKLRDLFAGTDGRDA